MKNTITDAATVAVKYGLIEEKEHPIVFYFEKMEEKS
jgi:hypothetical protein